MKTFMRIMFMFTAMFIWAVIITGCGTLNRSINPIMLNDDDMLFAKSLNEGLVSLAICNGRDNFVTKRTANKSYIFPPVIYWESFGVKGLYDCEYGHMEMFSVIPLIFSIDASTYNNVGIVSGRYNLTYISPLYSKAKVIDFSKPISESVGIVQFNLVPIPIVGINLYNRMLMGRMGDITSARYSFLNLPIFGSCFAYRYGPDSGRPKFLWIPVGEKL